MKSSKMLLVYILLTAVLGTLTQRKKKPCDLNPCKSCSKSTWPKWSCPNTYRCDKKSGNCCRWNNFPKNCTTAIDPTTCAPYKCQGGGSIDCNELPGPEKYVCISDPMNRYTMCCEDSVCFDNSGNMHRKYDGEWTELDKCTVCKCEDNNKRRCDDSKCETKCGNYSEFSPCPNNSCGKKVKIRKCINSKDDRDAELSMEICHPEPPAQCPQTGVALTEAASIVIGGLEVWPNFNYRWMALMYHITQKRVHCGGSILSPYHILTAAHCFFWGCAKIPLETIQKTYKIKTGKHDVTIVEAPLEQGKNIVNVDIHKNFNCWTFDNDIAIVTLDSPLQFNNHTHPINLPPNRFNNNIIKKLRKGLCKVIGWGVTNSSNLDQKSDVLMEVQLNLEYSCTLDDERYRNQVTNKMLCVTALNPNKTEGALRLDSCFGDSGGPFMCRENDKWYQYGIVSWGPPGSCGHQTGVYTKVSNYVNWITEMISRSGGWGEFSEYSPCSVSCGRGTRSRVKACTNPAPIGKGKCINFTHVTSEGEMVYVEDEECNTNPC